MSTPATANTKLAKTVGARKKKVSRPKSTTGKLKKLAKDVSSVKQAMSKAIEIKNFDVQLVAPSTIDNLGNFTSNLINPAQGLGNLFRVGDGINPTRINMRIRLASGTSATFVRVILFWDHEGNMTSTDLLDSFTLGGVMAPLANYPRGSRGAFSILYDNVVTLDNVENLQEILSLNLKLNKDIRYLAGTTTVERNLLRLFVVSDQPLGAAAASKPTYQFVSRVWYQDA